MKNGLYNSSYVYGMCKYYETQWFMFKFNFSDSTSSLMIFQIRSTITRPVSNYYELRGIDGLPRHCTFRNIVYFSLADLSAFSCFGCSVLTSSEQSRLVEHSRVSKELFVLSRFMAFHGTRTFSVSYLMPARHHLECVHVVY
jgi:hypothetical protein